jgi:hypothetical protein
MLQRRQGRALNAEAKIAPIWHETSMIGAMNIGFCLPEWSTQSFCKAPQLLRLACSEAMPALGGGCFLFFSGVKFPIEFPNCDNPKKCDM